jgi:hypothetical protein
VTHLQIERTRGGGRGGIFAQAGRVCGLSLCVFCEACWAGEGVSAAATRVRA